MKKILFVLSFLFVFCAYSDEPDWVSLGSKSVSAPGGSEPTMIFFSIVPNKPIKWIYTGTGNAEFQFSNTPSWRAPGHQGWDVYGSGTNYNLDGVPFNYVIFVVGPWGDASYTVEIFQADIDTCIPPTITSPSVINVSAGGHAAYTITATGSAMSTMTFIEILPDWITQSGSSIAISPPESLANTDYYITAYVQNDCGEMYLPITIHIGDIDDGGGDDPSGKVDTDDDVPAINEAKVAIVSAITELKTVNTAIKNSVTNIENDVSSIKSSVSSIDTEIKLSNVYLEEIRDLLTPDEIDDPIPSTENEIPEISMPEVEDNSNIDLDTSKFFDGKFGQLRGTLTEKGSEALSITIPVSQLLPSLGGSDRLDDWVLNFGAEPLSDWVFLCRTFLLGVLYLGTIFATVRILRTFEF